jgi:hypothetical protein
MHSQEIIVRRGSLTAAAKSHQCALAHTDVAIAQWISETGGCNLIHREVADVSLPYVRDKQMLLI